MMAEITESVPGLASDKPFGDDPEQDAKSFLLTIENKSISRLDHN